MYGSKEFVAFLVQALRWEKQLRLELEPLQLHYIDNNPIDLAFHHGRMENVTTILESPQLDPECFDLSCSQLLIRTAVTRDATRLLATLLRFGVSIHHRYYYGETEACHS